MADETNGATGTQADPGTQPPAGDAAAQAAGAGGEHQAAQQPESISLDEARKLRSESQQLRRRLKELEDADKARQDAQLSESEKQAKRVQELESALAAARERTLRLATVGTAARLGFADPDDAVRLVDPSAIEVGDDGVPANAEAVLTALAKAKPYLLAQQRPAGSFDTGSSAGRTAPRSFTREQLRDPKFYAEHAADIDAAAREGRITG